MKHSLCTLVCLLSLLCLGFSKSTGTIEGKILDSEGTALSYANVILHAATDSSIVKLALSEENGTFQFIGIEAAAYYVEVSYVGLPNLSTAVFDVTAGNTYQLDEIQLQAASAELAEVTVTAQKPLLELKPDKMVMNVENNATAAGNNALELLRKAPGVVIDNNENIALLGKSGVRIYIDGKPSPLTSSDLAIMLKSMQATDIESIEIITNPSSKYDAEGNAGIINIKMKKDQRLGANASLNLGASHGNALRYNGSLSSNYRNKTMNVFGRYSRYFGENPQTNKFYREQFGFTVDQVMDQFNDWQGHSVRLGTDFFLNKQHTIGFLVNVSTGGHTHESDSRSEIGRVGIARPDSILLGMNRSNGSYDNADFNVNYQFDNDKGTTWNIDADYGTYKSKELELQPNTYMDINEEVVLNERIFEMDKPTDINISTFKVDHERSLGEGKLGAGLKLSYIETDNTFDFYNVIDDVSILDENVSNQFNYTENVNAAYANYAQQFDKINIQAGVRMEQTNSEGKLTSLMENENENVKRTYTDFFPSAGITYQLDEKNTFQFNYSRRVNRPNYEDLNPFLNRLDELTFEQGNAFLNPEYTNKFQLTHTFNYALNTSLSYGHTKDVIARIVDTESDKGSFITWLNLAEKKDYSLNVSGNIPIKEWWSIYASLTGSHQANKGDLGDGKVIDLKVSTFNGYAQMNFRLPKDMSFELSGWYNSPSIWEGSFKMNEMWSMNAGFQKKILNGNGSIKLSINDIFFTNQWSGVSDFGNLYMSVQGNWDSRRFGANFSYLFGNSQVKSRRRSTGLEDESSRIKGN